MRLQVAVWQRHVLVGGVSGLLLFPAVRARSDTTTEKRDYRWARQHVDLDQLPHDLALTMIREWLGTLEGETLNVAGPRESSDGKIYKAVKRIITDLLKSDG